MQICEFIRPCKLLSPREIVRQHETGPKPNLLVFPCLHDLFPSIRDEQDLTPHHFFGKTWGADTVTVVCEMRGFRFVWPCRRERTPTLDTYVKIKCQNPLSRKEEKWGDILSVQSLNHSVIMG